MSDATKWKAEVHDDGLTWGVYDSDGEPVVWEAGGCDKTAALQIVMDHNEAQGLKARIAELEKALEQIELADKTVEYTYRRNPGDRNRLGKLAGTSQRWLTPREIAVTMRAPQKPKDSAS